MTPKFSPRRQFLDGRACTSLEVSSSRAREGARLWARLGGGGFYVCGGWHGADRHFFCQFEPLNSSQQGCEVV